MEAIAFQFAGSDLLERFEELRYEDERRLVDQQVDVFGHEHVGINPGLMTRAGLLQDGFYRFLGARRRQERKSVKATERDEVESLRLLEAFQTDGHAVIVVPLRDRTTTHSSR